MYCSHKKNNCHCWAMRKTQGVPQDGGDIRAFQKETLHWRRVREHTCQIWVDVRLVSLLGCHWTKGRYWYMLTEHFGKFCKSAMNLLLLMVPKSFGHWKNSMGRCCMSTGFVGFLTHLKGSSCEAFRPLAAKRKTTSQPTDVVCCQVTQRSSGWNLSESSQHFLVHIFLGVVML